MTGLKEFEKVYMDRNAHKSARIKFTTLVLQEGVNEALNPFVPVSNCWIPPYFIDFYYILSTCAGTDKYLLT